MKAKYIYGPINSKRLGRSLGIDIIPKKFCTFDCIYCQVGRTIRKTLRRQRFGSAAEMLRQLKAALKRYKGLTYVTFSGSGEPTLNIDLGKMIRKVKKVTDIPVAVITNSSLLRDKAVRQAIGAADLVLASLDAASPDIFKRLDRPHRDLEIKNIIKGLRVFRKGFKGKLWIEVMLVKGFNDTRNEIRKLISMAHEIGADKVQLKTITRPPAESFACPLSKVELKFFMEHFACGDVEIIPPGRNRRRRLGRVPQREGYNL